MLRFSEKSDAQQHRRSNKLCSNEFDLTVLLPNPRTKTVRQRLPCFRLSYALNAYASDNIASESYINKWYFIALP